MVIKKPPALPPDTGPGAGAAPPGVPQEAVVHESAENPESFDPQVPTIRRTSVPVVATTNDHPVIFTVLGDTNAIQFVADLLANLLLVDSTAEILPTSEAHSSYGPLDRNTRAIPNRGSEAKNFAKAYLAGLKASTKGDMKGKVLIRSRAKFETLKRNFNFLEWLNGSSVAPKRPKILLVRTDLQGLVRISAGFFFNVVPRHDKAANFQQQLLNSLKSSIQATGPIPEFQIEVHTRSEAGQKVRLYRMFTSTVQHVDILTEKMAALMPSPSKDISYIPQNVWDSLSAPKQTEYYNMQRAFDANHNSRLLIGLKNENLRLAKATTGGGFVSPGTGVSIYTWLTHTKAAIGSPIFTKVFPCNNGDIELWYPMGYDQEVRAWMSTSLAEIARLSGIDYLTQRANAERMFKNPERVWASLARVNRGISLPAQRSVYMDFTPPPGIVMFPTRSNVQGRQRRGPSQFKLVFDMEVDTTVSLLTTDDATSKSTTRSRRSRKKHDDAHSASRTNASGTNTATMEGGKQSADIAARKAVQVAVDALAKYPNLTQKGRRGAYYDTVSDMFENQLPVVEVGGVWVPLTEASLLDSRKKSTTMNYGLAARFATPQAKSSYTTRISQVSGQEIKSAHEVTRMAVASGTTMAGIQPTTEGFLETQAPSLKARTDGVGIPHPGFTSPILLASPTGFGVRPEGLVGSRSPGVSESDTMEIEVNQDEDLVYDDEAEAVDTASVGSQGELSFTSVSTAGQSVVTFAQVARRQEYDAMKGPDAVMHHLDATEEIMQHHELSSLSKLESKTKKQAAKTAKDNKVKKKSSLQAVAIQGAIEAQARRNKATELAAKQPIRPPARDSAGKMILGDDRAATVAEQSSSAGGAMVAVSLTDESSSAQTLLREMAKEMQRMKDENSRLTRLLEQAFTGRMAMTAPQQLAQFGNARYHIGHQFGTMKPTEQIDPPPELHQQQGSNTAIVEFTPTSTKRRSKKTTLQPDVVRSPPREPPGTPQQKKKSKVAVSPDANRYRALVDNNSDADMSDSEYDDETLADVESKLDNLNIRNTPSASDSIMKNGADYQK